ncbi:hypothetical protein FGE12_28830 [Aggregicoccus sp. 17bor-14]|uniref:DNA/RNA non-specific endonuclease n=1 Tax=Myxococcaceae TaxID=31 RepID=UPI00129CB0C5|nr:MULTISPECIES: DNA/RNA non-specific endonuclease [Myxococcaceae]MBF5046453.1 DNA/RNA non-specific endonuclease [Simulacricoccus sp. 17bor-14]MRI92171.1 hypothetical protein [Aggregicoccus sp. 17bor-14]
MDANGLKSFAFHRHGQAELAASLRPPPLAGIEPGGDALPFSALGAEAAARRYLSRAFESERLPSLEPVSVAGQASELQTLGTEVLPLTGTRTVKFRQVLSRIPVYGSLVTVELDQGNELLAINSNLGEPAGVDPVARLSPAQAMDVVAQKAGERARQAVPRLHYYFEPGARRWHLAYVAENVWTREGTLFDFVVDAHDGSLVAALPRNQSALEPRPGTGGNGKGLPLPLGEPPALPRTPAAPAPADDSGLEEARDGRGQLRRFGASTEGARKQLHDARFNVHTYDFGFRDLLTDDKGLPGSYVELPPEPWSSAGVSAHANAVEVARFLREVLKREGLDNAGGPLISSIQCAWGGSGPGTEWRNAAWIGTQMVYGQRKVGEELVSYAVALDVVAHEILHGLTDHSARLLYAGMSGALNESYSDIFGILVSNLAVADRERWSWEMGEELDASGVPIRDLRDPTRCGQPAHMDEYRQLPVDRPHDWGGVHVNSGIHNRAAYLLLSAKDAAGDWCFSPAQVAALFYIALTQYLSRTSGFGDSRRGVELAARSLFRQDPALEEKLAAVAAAFDGVGIREGLQTPTLPAPAPAASAPDDAGGLAGLEVMLAAAPSLVIPYDPDFLGGGFQVPLPMLTARLREDAFEKGRVLDYVHYSLAMNARRRTALFSACNVDASRMVRMGREGMPWLLDPRLPASAQLGPIYYANNAWDRGHLTRRQDALWGPVRVAREANAATFYYANAAPQHENFNQDEWAALEDWVLERAADVSYRLCVITGPVLQDDDPPLRDAQIPAAFWKVVALRDATADGDDLSVVAFLMKQAPMEKDKVGRELLHLKRYQVTVAAVEEWTGLDFGALRDADELAWSPLALAGAEPLQVFRPIERPEDIVFSGSRRRAAGGQIQPLRAAAPQPPRPGSFVH